MTLHIENEDWASNKTKDNTIQFHIVNRSFNYTASIKKNQCIVFIFLLDERATVQSIQNMFYDKKLSNHCPLRIFQYDFYLNF